MLTCPPALTVRRPLRISPFHRATVAIVRRPTPIRRPAGPTRVLFLGTLPRPGVALCPLPRVHPDPSFLSSHPATTSLAPDARARRPVPFFYSRIFLYSFVGRGKSNHDMTRAVGLAVPDADVLILESTVRCQSANPRKDPPMARVLAQQNQTQHCTSNPTNAIDLTLLILRQVWSSIV